MITRVSADVVQLVRSDVASIETGTQPVHRWVCRFPRKALFHHEAIQAPPVGYALQLLLASVVESQPRPRDEVLDRLRDQDFRTTRKGADPRADHDAEATRLPADRLDFARVNTDPDFEFERPPCSNYCLSGPNCASWTVERREEPVSCRVDLDTPVSAEHRPDDGVMALQQCPPRPVTQLDRLLRRADQVAEQDRAQDPVETASSSRRAAMKRSISLITASRCSVVVHGT